MSEPGRVEVRAVESASSKIQGGASALIEAQGLLNLGNPGLALEAFRKTLRDRPSAEALAGIAACYVSMGRDDLAKRNLEAALAIDPRSVELLQSIALVMDRLGLKEEAATAQSQARAILTESAQTNPPPDVPDTRSVRAAASAPLARVEAEPVSAPAVQAATQTLPDQRNVAQAVEEARRLVAARNLTSSVTVKLPPPRMASRGDTAGIRLQRVSPKEVVLVTAAKPLWSPVGKARVLTSFDDRRWRPLRVAGEAPNLRLLNAARTQGLATAARSGLMQRGWRRIDVGDHSEVRAHSIVLYPADKERIGKSLARHFRIASAQSKGRTVTILLGRDVASRL